MGNIEAREERFSFPRELEARN